MLHIAHIFCLHTICIYLCARFIYLGMALGAHHNTTCAITTSRSGKRANIDKTCDIRVETTWYTKHYIGGMHQLKAGLQRIVFSHTQTTTVRIVVPKEYAYTKIRVIPDSIALKEGLRRMHCLHIMHLITTQLWSSCGIHLTISRRTCIYTI